MQKSSSLLKELDAYLIQKEFDKLQYNENKSLTKIIMMSLTDKICVKGGGKGAAAQQPERKVWGGHCEKCRALLRSARRWPSGGEC